MHQRRTFYAVSRRSGQGVSMFDDRSATKRWRAKPRCEVRMCHQPTSRTTADMHGARLEPVELQNKAHHADRVLLIRPMRDGPKASGHQGN